MSCSLVEQRLDQLYGVREVKRSRLVVEVWGVASSRRKELHRVQAGECLGFALAVQSLVEEGGPSPYDKHAKSKLYTRSRCLQHVENCPALALFTVLSSQKTHPSYL